MLLIDAGNTCVKWRRNRDCLQIESEGRLPSGEVSLEMSRLAKELRAVSFVCISSVWNKERTSSLLSEIKEISNVSIYLAETVPSCRLLKVAYKEAERLGVDRWLAMLAAKVVTKGRYCVIDAGSAITVDVVDESGQHLGGLIFPGLPLMTGMLQKSTQRVRPKKTLIKRDIYLGVNTEECVDFGISFVLRSIGERLSDFLKDFGVVECVLTGGDREFFVDILEKHIKVRMLQNLVLDGLLVAYNENLLQEIK